MLIFLFEINRLLYNLFSSFTPSIYASCTLVPSVNTKIEKHFVNYNASCHWRTGSTCIWVMNREKVRRSGVHLRRRCITLLATAPNQGPILSSGQFATFLSWFRQPSPSQHRKCTKKGGFLYHI